MRILLVEDDAVLSDVLVQSLTQQRYVVDAVTTGPSGWQYAQGTDYDLILLDVGLPGLDGISLCKQLRDRGCPTPILLMTAKDAPHERIRGLDAGADDHVTKPLDLAELQARIRALLRRGEGVRSPVLTLGELKLDPITCQVTYGDRLLSLTPKEYSLLELFLRNPARVFSRAQIVEHLWTYDDPPLEESVKAHIKGLRQKLKTVKAEDWIENVYGIGYRLRDAQRLANQPSLTEPSTTSTDAPVAVPIETQFNQEMDGLWLRYQGLMVERLTILQEAKQARQAGALGESLRQQAAQAAHKLAGVLGMFGRDRGTQIARELETLLNSPAPVPVAALTAQIDALGDLLNLSTEPEPPVEPAVANRLLLIDTESELAQGLRLLSHPEGLGWAQVTTLADAQDWLREHTPDLVVLNMPTAQQHAYILLLSQLAAQTPVVPVIALAEADDLIDRVAIARAGAQGFLVKPVTASQVWDVATRLLERSRAVAVNVLVVDDDPVFLATLQPLLEPWGIRMTGLDNPVQFWQVLQDTHPDLLILDVEMPDLSGIELCQAVRTDPTWQSLPILFLTGRRDRATVQQVFAAGADDYIVKPVIGPELLTRITNRLERSRLFHTLSTCDPATGLTNQPQAMQALEQTLEQAQNRGGSFGLAIVKAMTLADINHAYGHEVGNRLLQQWGHLLRSTLHEAAVLSYWGFGEFVIGLGESPSDRLTELCTTLKRQPLVTLSGASIPVTVGMAIATYPSNGLSVQDLYRYASRSLTNTKPVSSPPST